MCGLLGVWGRPGAPAIDEVRLRARLDRLGHRGPDGHGTFVQGPSGLGVTRLAIQGDARAAAPLRSADGRVVLAFNGEVLAPQQESLRQLVGIAGRRVPPAAAGDAALLVEVLAALLGSTGSLQGPHLMGLLEGSMGAVVAWDLARSELWLARDRLGVKPLFTLETPDALHFASEMKPLLEAAPAARQPDLDGLRELLGRHLVTRHLPFRGVERLAPGAVWRVSPNGHVTRWAGGQGIRDLVDRRAVSPSAAVESLAAAVEASARAAAAVEPAPCLFLSGGVDSGAVAVLAGRPGLTALTGRFAPPGGPFDESALAAEAAAAGGLEHEILDLREGDLLGDLPAVIRALEMPMAGPGALALWRMAAAVGDDAKVVLTGTGGDELLAGYARTALVLGLAGPWTAGYEPLARRIHAAGAPFAARRRAARDRGADLEPLLAADFLAALHPPETREGAVEGIDALIHDEVEETLPMLLDVEDRILMAHGLEGRPVFCLGDVPRAAARVPVDTLVGPDGEGKRALRLALEGRLPEAVRRDPRKRGFPTPFAAAARGVGRQDVLAVLADRRFKERGWWNVEACRAALDRSGPAYDRALYALLSWEFWARAFLDGDALAPEDRHR